MPSGAENKIPLVLRIVELSNHAAIVTILFGNNGKHAAKNTGWQTAIYQISPAGKVQLWKPGKEYSTGAIWHADAEDRLYGFDCLAPEWIYVCRPNGKHIAKFFLPMLLRSPIAPALFAVRGKLLGFAGPNYALEVVSFAELKQAAAGKSGKMPREKSRLMRKAVDKFQLPHTVRQRGLRHKYRLSKKGKELLLTCG